MTISGFLRESLLVVKRWGRKWRLVKAKFLRAERWSRFGSLNVTETHVCWGALWASLWGSEKGFIHKELTVQWRLSCQLGFRCSLPGVPFLGLTAFQGSNPMLRVFCEFSSVSAVLLIACPCFPRGALFPGHCQPQRLCTARIDLQICWPIEVSFSLIFFLGASIYLHGRS